MSAISRSVRLCQLDAAGAVDAHDAGEPRAIGQLVDRVFLGLHSRPLIGLIRLSQGNWPRCPQLP